MSSRDPTRQYPYASQYASHPDLGFIPLLPTNCEGVKSALLVSQGDPPDLW
ncbi:BnaC03g49080D [Brassica napus]|uniref:BnaC03g49080D protein n=1 Tax=Brassica napus TaxID=3708 RepID=A0A078FNA4_BRANA|nr:BnaC03g49080D [Brassica napus]